MGTKLHNKLPDDIIEIESYKTFRKGLKSFLLQHTFYSGPGLAQWLRHCATSRAVPISNPGGVGHRDFSRGYR